MRKVTLHIVNVKRVVLWLLFRSNVCIWRLRFLIRRQSRPDIFFEKEEVGTKNSTFCFFKYIVWWPWNKCPTSWLLRNTWCCNYAHFSRSCSAVAEKKPLLGTTFPSFRSRFQQISSDKILPSFRSFYPDWWDWKEMDFFVVKYNSNFKVCRFSIYKEIVNLCSALCKYHENEFLISISITSKRTFDHALQMQGVISFFA